MENCVASFVYIDHLVKLETSLKHLLITLSYLSIQSLTEIHQIVFAKINLKICYPPLYEHEISHYEKANADLICTSIDQFPWDNRFPNLDVNQKVYLFDQIIKNILCNFIPHETVTCDDLRST